MLVKTWIKLVFVFIIIATIFQIAGLVSPLWIYLELGNVTIGVGLYYRIGCGAYSGNNCTSPAFNYLPFGYNSSATYSKASWEAIVWLETISAAFGLILSILMVVYLVGFGVWRKMNNLNIAMVFIAILSWLPLAVGLIIYIIYYGKVITRSPEISSQSFPWSPAMCLLAGVLFFVLTILIRTHCRNRNYIQNAIPTSTDSKMALNPSTKNQLMKRYYTPSPYSEDRRQALYASTYFNDKSHLLGNGQVAGAIENTGTTNTVFQNNYTRAIEYNTPEAGQDVSMSRVIQTNNLPVGAFATNNGTLTVTNQAFRNTIYERDLSSLLNKNTTINYAENTYGGQMGQAHIPNYQSEMKNINRQSYNERQWMSTIGQEVDRFQERNAVGNSTTLNRSHGYDNFSEMDAETVYYTGREGFRPMSLNRTDSFNTNQVRSATTNGYVLTRETRQPLQPVQEEHIVNDLTVIETTSGKMADRNKPFRIPADHSVVNGHQRSKDYTVHTRTYNDNLIPSQLILMPGHLSGKRTPYNGTYIYRPYSETSY